MPFYSKHWDISFPPPPFMNTLFCSSGILVPWKKTQCSLPLSLVVFLQSREAFLSSGKVLAGRVIVCLSFILWDALHLSSNLTFPFLLNDSIYVETFSLTLSPSQCGFFQHWFAKLCLYFTPYKVPGKITSPQTLLGMVMHAYHPSTQKVDSEWLETQIHSEDRVKMNRN